VALVDVGFVVITSTTGSGDRDRTDGRPDQHGDLPHRVDTAEVAEDDADDLAAVTTRAGAAAGAADRVVMAA